MEPNEVPQVKSNATFLVKYSDRYENQHIRSFVYDINKHEQNKEPGIKKAILYAKTTELLQRISFEQFSKNNIFEPPITFEEPNIVPLPPVQLKTLDDMCANVEKSFPATSGVLYHRILDFANHSPNRFDTADWYQTLKQLIKDYLNENAAEWAGKKYGYYRSYYLSGGKNYTPKTFQPSLNVLLRPYATAIYRELYKSTVSLLCRDYILNIKKTGQFIMDLQSIKSILSAKREARVLRLEDIKKEEERIAELRKQEKARARDAKIKAAKEKLRRSQSG